MADEGSLLNVDNDVEFNTEDEGYSENSINAFQPNWPGWEKSCKTPEHHTAQDPYYSLPDDVSRVQDYEVVFEPSEPQQPASAATVTSSEMAAVSERSDTPPYPPPTQGQIESVAPTSTSTKPTKLNVDSNTAPGKRKTKAEKKAYHAGHIWPPLRLPHEPSKHQEKSQSVDSPQPTIRSVVSVKTSSAKNNSRHAGKSRGRTSESARSTKPDKPARHATKSSSSITSSRNKAKGRVSRQLTPSSPEDSAFEPATPASPGPSSPSTALFEDLTAIEKEVVDFILQDPNDEEKAKAAAKAAAKREQQKEREIQEWQRRLIVNPNFPKRFTIYPPQVPERFPSDPYLNHTHSRFYVTIPVESFERKCDLPHWKWWSFNRFGKLRTDFDKDKPRSGFLQLRPRPGKDVAPSDPRYRREERLELAAGADHIRPEPRAERFFRRSPETNQSYRRYHSSDRRESKRRRYH